MLLQGRRTALISIFFIILLGVSVLPIENFAFAKKFELSSENVEKIDAFFDIAKLFGNIILPAELKKILNTVVKGGETTADITYGVLTLSTISEIEFIDMVTSQRYKAEADAYFNSAINERVSLYNYYSGIGSDIPKVLSGTISGPMGAFTLSSFDLSNNTITAILALHVLQKELIYDALWVYFDDRRHNETHETAWYEASTKLGVGITNSNIDGLFRTGKKERVTSPLPLQFAELWSKWGDKTTAAGVKPEVKEAFKKEMQSLVIEATQVYAQQPKPEPSFIAKVFKALGDLNRRIGKDIGPLADGLVRVLRNIGSTISKLNPFAAGFVQEKPQQPTGITIIEKDNSPKEKPAKDTPLQPTKPSKPFVENLAGPSSPQFNPTKLNSVKEESVAEEKESEMVQIKQKEEKLGKSKDETKETTPIKASVPTTCTVSQNSSPPSNIILINEVAWMGTEKSSNDEWIELKNISSTPINLAGWQIIDKENQIHIIFTETHSIQPHGFFILERTDDSTLPGIAADVLYAGALGNSDEALYLFDGKCILQDSTVTSSVWPAGDNQTKRTMERKENKDWQTSAETGGTPNAQNSAGYAAKESAGGAAGGGFAAPAAPSKYAKLLITEVQTAGTSSQTEEFIELYNPNNGEVDLTEWYLQKKTQSASAFSTFASSTLFAGKRMGPGSYFLIAREGSSFSANADIMVDSSLANNNTLALKNPSGEIVDKVGWGSVQDAETRSASNPESGQSLARTFQESSQSYVDTDDNSSDFSVSTTPTPKTKNVISPPDGGSFSSSYDSNASDSSSSSSSPDSSSNPSRTVVFNEIAWMGTQTSANDEWIELFNTTNNPIDLTGWHIEAEDGAPSITLTTTITAQDFFLLERTSESTISSIAANLVYTGALENEGEKLRLYDAAGALVDKVDASNGWFAGNNTTKQSMERISASADGSASASWAANNLISHNGKGSDGTSNINGTPKAKNSVSKTETEIIDIRLNEFDSVTLTKLGAPYYTNGDITVAQNKTLVIEPGVTVRFEQNNSHLDVNGTLTATGTSQNNIVLTHGTGGNSWCGLQFTSTSINSVLDYVTIEKAAGCYSGSSDRSITVEDSSITLKHATLTQGNQRRKIYLKNSNSLIDSATISDANFSGDPEATGIVIEGGSPTVTNSTFSNNTIGIWNKFPSGNPTISNNTFSNNSYPIKLSSSSGVLAGNSASGNTYNGILLEGAASIDLILEKDSIPYLIEDFTVSSGKTLTIKPGVIIKFANLSGTTPQLTVQGNVSFQGAIDNNVTLTALGDNSIGGTTSSSGANQSWRRISFAAGGTGTFEYAAIKNGGLLSDGEGMLDVNNGSITVHNSTLQQSGRQAIYSSLGTITVQNTSIEVPANSYAFRIQNGSCPTLTNVTITGNGQTFVPGLVECTL